MEKDLIEGQLGQIGTYDIEFKDGALCAKLVSPVGVEIEVKIQADAILDALAKAIPGKIDDAVLGLVKTALKS